MAKKNQTNEFVLPSLIMILQLAFLYFIKYQNQNLAFTNFSVVKTGNLFNLILYVGIAIGLFIVYKKKLISKKVVITFFTISWLFLLLAFISTKVKILSESDYLLNLPTGKILTGVLFLLFLMTLLFFLFFVWARIFSGQKPKIIKIVISTCLILFLFFIAIIIYVDNIGYTSGRWSIKKNKNNMAVVLGAAVWTGNRPSPTLSARVDKAIELLNQGFVGKIILTGGKAPGELPESEVAYEYARACGVDTSKISYESFTSSTSDQIQWIKNNIVLKDSTTEIILVSDAYHLPRAIEISKFFVLDVKVAESSHKLYFKDLLYNKIRESIALFNFWNFAL